LAGGGGGGGGGWWGGGGGGPRGGEMNQALYAHMNNKRKTKKKLQDPKLLFYFSVYLVL
jgi:hypothetical protein